MNESATDPEGMRASTPRGATPGTTAHRTSWPERLLSWALAGFILLAMSWLYVNVDDEVRESRQPGLTETQARLDRIDRANKAYADSLGLFDEASKARVYQAERRLRRAKEARDTARERYRTKLDEGRRDRKLRDAYRRADAKVTELERELAEARSRNSAAQRKVNAFQKAHRAEFASAEQKVWSYERTTDRIVFILRLLLTLGTLLASVRLLRAVSERAPRMQPLGQAVTIASSLMFITLIVDYGEISFDFATFGPMGMAILGSLITITAFLALQRYLRKRRPKRRLQAGECPECGFPATGCNFCENCGTQLRVDCPECGQWRRLGVANCRACGAS